MMGFSIRRDEKKYLRNTGRNKEGLLQALSSVDKEESVCTRVKNKSLTGF